MVAGCLEAPPTAAPTGDGGGGDGSPAGGADASRCPETSEPFDRTDLGGLWGNPTAYGNSTWSVSAGELHVTANPDAEVDGDISLRSLQDFDLTSADLRAKFRASQTGGGTSGIGWYAAVDDYFLISNVGSAIRATYAVPLGGGEQIACAPCADYTLDDTVIAQMREVGGEIVFTATVDGVSWTLGSAPYEGRRYPVRLFAHAPLADGSAALNTDSIEWTDCEAAGSQGRSQADLSPVSPGF